jgi:hypothetical protein
MEKILGLIGPIATGYHEERIYAIIHADEGDIVTQLAKKNGKEGVAREIALEKTPHVSVVETVQEPRSFLGYSIDGGIDEDELLLFMTTLNQNGPIAVTTEGEYATVQTMASIIAEPLYKVLALWTYQPQH